MQEIFDNLISNAVFEIQNQNKKISKKPYLDLFLSGMALKGLYDTGADVSCIDEKTFRRIPVDKRPAVKLIDKAYRFKGAGDQDLDVRGRFTLPLKVGQKQLAHEFFVIKSLGEELILGIDFMHAHKLNYDTHTKRFSWRREGVWEKGLFKVCEQHTLPPLSLSLSPSKPSPANGATAPAGAECGGRGWVVPSSAPAPTHATVIDDPPPPPPPNPSGGLLHFRGAREFGMGSRRRRPWVGGP